MTEEGRGWGWNCPCTKCTESWLTETSATFGDSRVMNTQYCFCCCCCCCFYIYNFVVIFGIWVFHTQFTPKDWLLFLEKKTTEGTKVSENFRFGTPYQLLSKICHCCSNTKVSSLSGYFGQVNHFSYSYNSRMLSSSSYA